MPGSRGKEAPKRGHTYVINHDYDVVYMDRAARKVFPGGRIGEKCYACFRGYDKPCEDCIWRGDADSHATQSVIYSARLDQWYEMTCIELDWFDRGPCVLFSGCPIDERSRSLFTTLSEPSSYDELFELNLTDGTYKVLYHETDKYAMPALEGRLDALREEVLGTMIHPDDRARFAAMWDLSDLVERIDAAGGSLHGEFRKLLAGGGWAWARQSAVPVKRGTSNETVIMCFVSDVDGEVRERDRQQADAAQIRLLRERDRLTGLYNAATFYDKAEALLAAHPAARYEAMYVDIEHFKIYNEWHGREAGDAILRALAERLAEDARRFGGVAGYLGGDDFALVVPLGSIAEERVEHELKRPPFDTEDTIGFQPALGVCAIAPGESVVTACDHAMIAMNSVKASYAKRVAWYRTSMAEELEAEAKTLLEVKQALKNREFILYFQPQCSTRTGRVVGLEALIRWQHPERGIVMPGEFIPVLERNGFIASLDLYAWDEACRHIRSWIDRGGRPIPVSVNISRADLYAIDVVETLEELVTRYGLTRSLLELEITESAYAEDEKMADAVNRLKELGFTILMDDFGSGYSSLNMLKSINVDIIKIDMGFLNRERDPQRGESILEAIVSMARLMDLRIIAEGAETAEQVEFLRNIGCDYAQGFYFHRPMDKEALEELLTVEGVIDYRGVLSPSIEMIDMDVLVHEDEMSRAIIDNLIGGMAVYAAYDDHFEIMQVNNEYYRVTGSNPVDLKERQATIWRQVHPDDLASVMELFRKAELHPVSGAEGVVRRYRLSGELMWMKMRVFFLSRQEDRRLFYSAVEDVTDRQRREMASLGSVSDEGRIFELLNARSMHHWCVNLTRDAFLDADDRALLERHLGMRFQDWERFDVWETIRSVVNAGEQDARAVDALLDRRRMLEDFEEGVSSRMTEYRRRADDDAGGPGERWTELRYHLMRFEERDDVYAYLYVMDIDERKRRELSLQERAEHDALTGLLNRDTSSARLPNLFSRAVEGNVSGAFVIVDLDDFKRVNDRFGHLCGDSVLSGIGKHLRAAFRKDDLICRWGGDEFIVYCEDISSDDIMRRVATLCEDRWHAATSGGKTVELSVSAGIAMVPEHGVDFATVYDRADTALYQAKKEGKARFRMHGAREGR